MPTRALKTHHAEYLQAEWSGRNECGWSPTMDKVLILIDAPAARTSGNIHLADDLVERLKFGAQTGTIVAVGPDAFVWNGDRTRRLEGAKPSAGDRVYIEPYAGQMVLGHDGRDYRLVDDKSIGGVEDKRID